MLLPLAMRLSDMYESYEGIEALHPLVGRSIVFTPTPNSANAPGSSDRRRVASGVSTDAGPAPGSSRGLQNNAAIPAGFTRRRAAPTYSPTSTEVPVPSGRKAGILGGPIGRLLDPHVSRENSAPGNGTLPEAEQQRHTKPTNSYPHNTTITKLIKLKHQI